MSTSREHAAGSAISAQSPDATRVAFDLSALPSEVLFEIQRPRLDEPMTQLARGDRHTLAVWAAAGAGKTVLMAHWARALAARGELVHWMHGGSVPDTVGSLHTASSPVFLFIDDAHRITSTRARAALTALLDDSTGRIRVVVGGRYAPVPGLAHLQASGRLLELRTDDLAFDGDEVALLASRCGVPLEEPAATALATRTAGWAAAIGLAMPWLARTPDSSAAVEEFTGDDGAVADFLISEVLDGLDETTRRMLTAVAVDRYVPFELASRLCNSGEIAEIARRVAASHALITVSANGMNFHPVLLAFLQAEARRADPAAAVRTRTIAAYWYAAHERAADALQQAVDSGDLEVLADLLSRVGLELALAGHSRLIAAALACFGQEDEEPLVSLVLRLLLDAPTFADARRAHHLVAQAEKAAAGQLGPGGGAWVVALDAVRCFMGVRERPSFAGASRLIDATAMRERQTSLGLDLLCATAEGWLLATIGESERANRVLHDVRVSAHRAGLTWLFLVASEFSIGILSERGRWDEAVVIEDRLVDAADRFTSPARDRVRRRVEVVAAKRRYLRCAETDSLALGEVVASDPLGLDPELSVAARMLELLPQLDRTRNPRRPLDEIERLMRETGLYVPRILALAAPRIVAARLGLDGRARAKEAAEVVSSVLGADSLEAAIARYVLAAPSRTTDQAARQLEDASASAHAWHPASFVTAALLLARSAEENGRTGEADALTTRAIELAVRYRIERPFLAPAVDGIGLVRSRLGRFGHLEDEARRIAACAPPETLGYPTDALVIESLTAKEREVLAELPVHQSVAEIAQRHSLSVNTVKTHLRNIYQKLGASDRSEAVAVAQSLGII
jgi:ATP/maltotriose-dependent transcriptional regulator MalT